MELELRSHFQVLQQGDFIDQATSAIKSNEDVLFFGSMLSAEWDETFATNLFDRIIHLWITIRGFSYASAWIERHKNAKKISYPEMSHTSEDILQFFSNRILHKLTVF